MSNIQFLIPCIIISMLFLARGIILIFTKPTLRAIEIQDKYRKKRGESPMDDENTQKLFIKHRIIGAVLLILAIGQLAFGIIILPA